MGQGIKTTEEDAMPIEEMTNEALAEAHGEMMAKAKVARADGDLDLAQRYLSVIRPMNHEMARRMGWGK